MVAAAILDKKRNTQASIQPLAELTRNDMQAVNRMILARAGSDVEMIPEVVSHLISSGGKRLRPMITLAAARMSGYGSDQHIRLAAAVEFMHTATLLHDDVVDESGLRRGRSTARKIWGNQASVLVGDFLLGQAFKMMVEAGSLPCLDILSSAAAVIAEGEVMQLATANNLETSEEDYLAVINAKTAALFSAAAEVGPVIAGDDEVARAALARYGTSLGLAFQLVDDALDYSGSPDSLGKNTGDDFREGKITMPVILSFARGSQDERLFWKKALEEGENDDAALETARMLMNRHRSLDDTVSKACHYGEDARQALQSLASGVYRDALIEVVDFCISRVN